MGKNVSDRESSCKIDFNVSGDANRRWVSERRKKTFPHVIVSSTGDIKTKRVRIGPSDLDGTNPRFLDD